MTEREFGTVFAKLAMQLRWTDADGVTIRAYFDALQGLPLEAVGTAADAFAREAGRKYPPTSAEWHQGALDARSEIVRKRLALPAGRTEPWRHECASCEDTGWVVALECDGSPLCGRVQAHPAHPYTKPCGCRATNHTFQRHQQIGYGA